MRRLPTIPVILAGFAAFLDLYMTQPLLPLLARTFKASTFHVGLTITAPTVAVAITAPFIGRLADRLGLRRVIVGSACALTVATVLAATSNSLQQLIFWRFVQGIATPGIFASTVAYIHEVWPASHSGRATAAYMSGTVLGGFTGRAVAGLMAADVSWPGAFVALGLLNGAVAAALWLWLPREPSARGVGRANRTRSFSHLLRNRRLIATCGVGFCVLFTQVAMFTYVTFHVAAPPYNLSTTAIGWLFVVYLVGAVVTPLSGRWIDAHGHRAGIGVRELLRIVDVPVVGVADLLARRLGRDPEQDIEVGHPAVLTRLCSRRHWSIRAWFPESRMSGTRQPRNSSGRV